MYIEKPRLRYTALAVAILVVAATILAIERPWQPPACGTTEAGTPDLCGAGSWINSDGEDLALLEAQDRVVLVDFWTYSCINCIRTLPHLTALYNAYAPYGFVLIGVHSPEFRFEKDKANVEDAVEKHGIRYPVVQDNDFHIWENFHNRFWPAHYLIDADGKIVYTHFGEGAYEETEQKVRELLMAANVTDLPDPIEPLDTTGMAHDDITPELYAGAGRQPWTLGNEEGYQAGKVVTYEADDAPVRDRIYLDGRWFNGDEALRSEGTGSILLRFRAGAANFVVEPDEPACLPVTLDGAPVPTGLRGKDVVEKDGGTCVQVEGPDSYDLYEGPVDEHVVRIDVPDGLDLYTFAFSGRDEA